MEKKSLNEKARFSFFLSANFANLEILEVFAEMLGKTFHKLYARIPISDFVFIFVIIDFCLRISESELENRALRRQVTLRIPVFTHFCISFLRF